MDKMVPRNHNQAPRKGLVIVGIGLVMLVAWMAAGAPGLPQ